MKSLRVLHLIGGGDTGGAMSYVLPLLCALRGQGCDARLLCLGQGGLAVQAARRNIPVEVVDMSHPWDVRALAPLRRQLTASNWDVVHTHGMRANLAVRVVLGSASGRILAGRILPGGTPSGRPLLFTSVHSDLALDYADPVRARAYVVLDRATRRCVDRFCCVSRDLARRLIGSGISETRVHVVHPGFESGEGVAFARPVADEQPPTVGTVARLVPVKDIGLLLQATAALRRKIPDVRLLLVGDGPERGRLEREAADLGLARTVEFLGHVREIWPALAHFQVFAITSTYEGVPFSVLEAMSAGIPVVATAVGGLPEVVEEGVNGFLVEKIPDREAVAAALADRMARLLLDPGLRARMGEAGRRQVTEVFSVETAGRKMLKIYERELVGVAPGRRLG